MEIGNDKIRKKGGCVFPMVIWSEFLIGQWTNCHREDATHFKTVDFSLFEAVRELVLLVTPEYPSSFVICSGRLLNNSKSLIEIIGEPDWTKCGPIRLIIVNSHLFSFWTNLSITYGLTNHCPYSTLKDYFTSAQFISRKFGICRSCDPKKLQIGFE